MITKFLINYLNFESTPVVRHQMLDAMSKILAFTIDEKQLLGLVKKPSIEENAA
jgi:hypothetical protein